MNAPPTAPTPGTAATPETATTPSGLERPLPQPRADLGLREGYHSPQAPAEVRLNTNESPFPPPRQWVEAVSDMARDIAFNRYPDRSAVALREAIAKWHGVHPSQVFAANGSNEVLQSLCLAYGGAGRKAIMWEPTYALHSHIAHLTGTEVVQWARTQDFAIDLASAVRDLGNASAPLVFLCSPNNPTGLAEDEATVRAIVAASNGLVVVDEAYGQFASWSALSLVSEEVPLVVVRTYSKTWSMAGLRLGYMIGPAAVVETMERVVLPYHLDVLKQAAGRVALQFSSEMEQRVAAVVEQREHMIAEMARLPLKVWPSKANFVLWRPLERPGPQVWEELLGRSVLVRSTSGWPELEGCLRTTVGTPAENDRFLTALREVLV